MGGQDLELSAGPEQHLRLLRVHGVGADGPRRHGPDDEQRAERQRPLAAPQEAARDLRVARQPLARGRGSERGKGAGCGVAPAIGPPTERVGTVLSALWAHPTHPDCGPLLHTCGPHPTPRAGANTNQDWDAVCGRDTREELDARFATLNGRIIVKTMSV